MIAIRSAAFVFLLVPFTASSEEPYGPFNLQSGKVTVPGSGAGKTAHRDQCYEATNDRFFVENSWNAAVISQAGKKTSCSIGGIERKKVTLMNGDVPVEVSLPYKFCVAAHAETGSGMDKVGRTAWIECEITAKLNELTK